LQPYIYAQDRASFLIATDQPIRDEDDLPRNHTGRAIIVDPRNDENVLISQLHLAFLKYHNRVVAEIRDSVDPPDLFDEARTVVRWHYQWIVLNEFLPLIVGPSAIADVLTRPPGGVGTWNWQPKFYTWENNPFMPVEFSGAAFRFGHSMVRSSYVLNAHNTAPGVPLFDTSGSGSVIDMRGFRSRPQRMRVEWNRFFKFPEGSDSTLQHARSIDGFLSNDLLAMPPVIVGGATRPILLSLPYRNLDRSAALGLPSGQAVARTMGIPASEIIGDEVGNHSHEITLAGIEGDGRNLGNTGISRGELTKRLASALPLWYYILKEAEVFGRGAQLGRVGSCIVAEVMTGLVYGDGFSFIQMRPLWKPQLGRFGCTTSGEFYIADLIAHAEQR